MKTTLVKVIGYRLAVMGVAAMLLLTNTVQAVNYKNSYKAGRVAISGQQSVISIQTTAPAVGFQSTSAYSGQWNQDAHQSMLNADGTVNGEAYGIGRRPGIRRDPVAPPPNPGDPDEEEDEGNVPLGNGLWALMLLAFAYACVRKLRREREP
ncbi:MAG: hypothetical protein IKS76_05810 [Paludibacteraceae bacterium]|nr:hypothetical protein [Paludibacteraceae bacterium]